MSFENKPLLIPQQLKQRQIWSPLVILVPYRSHHVPKYNKWMQDVDLQYLTGSEPLTLDDEYKMLESWNKDPNKYTFIVLDRELYDSLSNIENKLKREVESMIGDVNLYISIDEETVIAEIEIMIAETWAQNRGRGREAAKLMMKFGYELLKIQKFQAKIKVSNIRSQKLFKDVFGFCEIARSDIFNEITYLCDLSKKKSNNHKLKKLFDKSPSYYHILNLDK